MVVLLNFKSGILQDKSDLKQLLLRIIRELMVSSLSMISLNDNHSKTSKTGLPKLINMETRTLLSFLSEISWIWRLTDKSNMKKVFLSIILGKTLADSLGIKFLETSAKDAVNVEKAFTTLSNEIKSKVQGRPTKGGPGGKANPGTSLRKTEEKKKSGCC